MEIQIEELVSAIRKEGVDAANQERERILAEAKEQAAQIVAQAVEQARKRLADAEKETQILQENAAQSAQQAQRDAMLSFRQALRAEYERLLCTEVKKTMTGNELGLLIQAALAGQDLSAYEVQIGHIRDSLQTQLAEEIRQGLELRQVGSDTAGFRLAAKDGSGYFDCSDEAVMQILLPYFRQ